MKKSNKTLLFIMMFLLILVTTSCSIRNQEQLDYYSNEENYIEVTGVINHVEFDVESETLYLGFTSLSQKLDDDCFKVVGDAYSTVVTYDEYIQVGKTATFVTAPKYYGDGYVMPIVSLSIDDQHILEYEIGFSSLLNWLKK